MPTHQRESQDERYLSLGAVGRRKELEKRVRQLTERVLRAEVSGLPIMKAKAEKALNEATWQLKRLLREQESGDSS